jgi:hypothetical protein
LGLSSTDRISRLEEAADWKKGNQTIEVSTFQPKLFRFYLFPTDHSLLHWDPGMIAFIFTRNHPTPKKKKKIIILLVGVIIGYFFFQFQTSKFQAGLFTIMFSMVSYPQKQPSETVLRCDLF